METYERVRILRKEYLKLSQTAFAEQLGTNRDIINNIENNRLARPEQKLSLLKLICKEFNVSEDWLLNGSGEMFTSDSAEYSTMIDQIMDGESEFAKNIFKTFAAFDAEDWKALERMMKKYKDVSSSTEIAGMRIPSSPEELEKLHPPIEMDKNKNNAG